MLQFPFYGASVVNAGQLVDLGLFFEARQIAHQRETEHCHHRRYHQPDSENFERIAGSLVIKEIIIECADREVPLVARPGSWLLAKTYGAVQYCSAPAATGVYHGRSRWSKVSSASSDARRVSSA